MFGAFHWWLSDSKSHQTSTPSSVSLLMFDDYILFIYMCIQDLWWLSLVTANIFKSSAPSSVSLTMNIFHSFICSHHISNVNHCTWVTASHFNSPDNFSVSFLQVIKMFGSSQFFIEILIHPLIINLSYFSFLLIAVDWVTSKYFQISSIFLSVLANSSNTMVWIISGVALNVLQFLCLFIIVSWYPASKLVSLCLSYVSFNSFFSFTWFPFHFSQFFFIHTLFLSPEVFQFDFA